jgi:hypothetical protein
VAGILALTVAQTQRFAWSELYFSSKYGENVFFGNFGDRRCETKKNDYSVLGQLSTDQEIST